jgi:hypothetical protein
MRGDEGYDALLGSDLPAILDLKAIGASVELVKLAGKTRGSRPQRRSAVRLAAHRGRTHHSRLQVAECRLNTRLIARDGQLARALSTQSFVISSLRLTRR